MTREEAIKMVQAHKFPKPTEEWQMLNNEAIDMAIEALSECTKGYSTMSEEYDEAIESLSADAVQGWRTGKPTEQGKYMVTLDSFGHKRIDLFHYGKPLMPNRKVRGKCWYRCDDEWGDVVYDDIDILAWMPFPKPYREDGEI